MQPYLLKKKSNKWKIHSFRKMVLYIVFILLLLLFYFTIPYWFCHTLTWIRHRSTWVPNPEHPSHHPPHIISLAAPSILYPVSNLDWRFISYIIVFILNEENKLQYLKWFILKNLTERSGLQKKLKILNQIITQISGLK